MRRHLTLILASAVATALVFGLTGCSDDDTTTPGVNEFELLSELGDDYFTGYLTPSGQPVNVTASAVYPLITDGNMANDPYIMDWRKPEHFALGHIAGAVNVSLAGFDQAINQIPAGKSVLNVCYTGQTASYTTSAMNMMGFEAQNLKFGMCGWSQNHAVTLGKWENAISDDYAAWLVTQPTVSTQTYAPPVLSTGKKTGAEILRERFRTSAATGWKTISVKALYDDFVAGNADDYFVINYFTENLYTAGHIPGAVRFQPKLDLQLGAKLATVPPDKKVVVYCFTGQTSAQVVSYLNALGYDAYSLLYGVNSICHTNGAICTVPYHAPDTDYPVVTGM